MESAADRVLWCRFATQCLSLLNCDARMVAPSENCANLISS
jgi:hypothetical protein